MANANHDRLRDLLEPYVLGALDDGERGEVAAHLETCPSCRRTAADLAEAARSLPLAVAAASPLELPASLKSKVLERIGGPEQVPRARRWWRPSAALGLATIALAALFVAWNARLDEAQSQEKELRARVARLQGLQPIVLEVVDSRHTVKRFLVPPEERAESRAYGKVFTRTDLPNVVVMANRLPQPPAGQAYHLWLTSRGQTRLAGVLPVDRQGFALLVFTADRVGPAYEDARLLLQPRGARRPSGVPFLIWNVES
jgi:hypothetical protein